MTNTNAERSLSGRVDFDGAEYYGKIGVQESRGGSKRTYVPILEYRTPFSSSSLVQGEVEYVEGEKVQLNLRPAGSDEYALEGQCTYNYSRNDN